MGTEAQKRSKRLYNQRHKDRRIAQNKRYRERNREAVNARQRVYYSKHPEMWRAVAARRRARKLDAFVEDIDRAALYDRDEGVCGICRELVARDAFHVDHVIPLVAGGEHSYANTQVAHPACNIAKGTKTN